MSGRNVKLPRKAVSKQYIELDELLHSVNLPLVALHFRFLRIATVTTFECSLPVSVNILYLSKYLS